MKLRQICSISSQQQASMLVSKMGQTTMVEVTARFGTAVGLDGKSPTRNDMLHSRMAAEERRRRLLDSELHRGSMGWVGHRDRTGWT